MHQIFYIYIIINVFRIGSVIKPEKLLITVYWLDQRSNRGRTGTVINLYFIILYIIKILKITKK